jgi:hypothetical protein
MSSNTVKGIIIKDTITKGIIILLLIALLSLIISLFSSVQDAKDNVLNNGLTTSATPLTMKHHTALMPVSEGAVIPYDIYTVTFSYSVNGKEYKLQTNSSTEKQAENQMREEYVVKYLKEDPSKAALAKVP